MDKKQPGLPCHLRAFLGLPQQPVWFITVETTKRLQDPSLTYNEKIFVEVLLVQCLNQGRWEGIPYWEGVKEAKVYEVHKKINNK